MISNRCQIHYAHIFKCVVRFNRYVLYCVTRETVYIMQNETYLCCFFGWKLRSTNQEAVHKVKSTNQHTWLRSYMTIYMHKHSRYSHTCSLVWYSALGVDMLARYILCVVHIVHKVQSGEHIVWPVQNAAAAGALSLCAVDLLWRALSVKQHSAHRHLYAKEPIIDSRTPANHHTTFSIRMITMMMMMVVVVVVAFCWLT